MADHKYLTSPPKITTMTSGVPYIDGNEAAERFSYYGMNSILAIFMTKYLLDKMGHLSVMQPANAEAWYHTFVSALYFLPILGAILADAVFGKFRVVFWLSIVYCGGHFTLALMGSPVAHSIEPRYLLAIGLLMIAMGAGGIKPCVLTNVGGQIGRASCRGRGEISVGGGSLKKKKKKEQIYIFYIYKTTSTQTDHEFYTE